MSDRPSRQPLPGNLRICVNEAPAGNRSNAPSSHPKHLGRGPYSRRGLGVRSQCSWSPGTPVALQHSQVGDHRGVGRLCLLLFRWRPVPLCHRWPLVGFGRRRRWWLRCLSCGMRCGRGRLAHLLLLTVSFGHGCGAGMPCCGSCVAGASTSRKTAWNRIHRNRRNYRNYRNYRNCVTRRWWWRLWWGSGHVPAGGAHRSTSRSRWGSWKRVWRPAPSSGRRRGCLSSGTR